MQVNNTYIPPQKTSVFTYIERVLQQQSLFLEGLPTRYIPPILYVFFITILYIGNTHQYEKTLRRISQLEPLVEELRIEFTTLKSSYIVENKQSVIAHRVAPKGLYESKQPPCKLVFDPHEQ